MDNFCGSKLWDSALSWDTTDPYLTQCFEESFVATSPTVFLLLFGFIDGFNMWRSNSGTRFTHTRFNLFFLAKVLLSTVLGVVHLCLFVRFAGLPDELPFYAVDWASPALQISGYILISILTLLTYRFGIHSSGVQFLFWFLSLLTQGVLFRTALRKYASDTNDKLEILYETRIIAFPLICMRFFLECFRDDVLQTRKPKFRLDKPSPDKTSTFLLKLLFLWYDSLAWAGYRRPLTRADLWDLNPLDRSEVQTVGFCKYWRQEQEKATVINKGNREGSAKPGILVPLFKCFGSTFAFGVVLKISSDLLVFVQPEMLRSLVSHVTRGASEPAWRGYLYTAVIVSAAVLQSVLSASSAKRALLIGMRMRAALSNAIFRKALVISNTGKRESTLGEIVNLMAVDAQKLADMMPMLISSLGSPLQVIICVWLLYNTLGASIFAGLGVLLLLIPTNALVAVYARRYQAAQMHLKDQRIRLTSEVLSGMKILKLYAWEPSYQAQIEDIRAQEMIFLRKSALLNSLALTIFTCAPVLVSLASFGAFVLSDPQTHTLNAEKAFVALSLFNIMRTPMILLPTAVSLIAQALVSVKRLNNFLNKDELDTNAVTHDPRFEDPITVKQGTFSWTKEGTTLRDINLQVKSGDLVAVVGSIGSGKSSLLCSLLGDLTKQHAGVVNTNGTIAYVSQVAWIQNATLRENILFGTKLDAVRYDRVLDACALKPDLQVLPAGDQTEIGEKGINLSGGQKQRVALARAAYKEATVYLLDDPLSAVDSHVASHIFDKLIGPKGMLCGSTRLLVTHGVSYLPSVDRIVVLKEGRISEEGTYKELLMKQGEFSDFLIQHLREEVKSEGILSVDGNSEILESRQKTKPPISKEMKNQLVQEEVVAEGVIKMDVYSRYFKAGGLPLFLFAIFINVAAVGLSGYSSIWLSDWSNAVTHEELVTGSTSKATTDKYLIGYGTITGIQSLTMLVGIGSLAIFSLIATQVLHSAALTRVLHAPMSYFDTTLLGRLINRFARDVDTTDNVVPHHLRMFTPVALSVLAAFIVISYKTPIFIAFIVPMAVVYILLQRFHAATSRQLKRLESVTRSPIYSHFGEAISGSTTIRAFGMQDKFVTESERRVDSNHKCYFPFITSNLWISLRLEFIGALIILATCLFSLLSRDTLSPGDAGLVITYALQITSLLNLLALKMSDLETNIVSVERLGELRELPQEAAWEGHGNGRTGEWPQEGEIRFENYSTRYRDGLDLVLQDISCTIHPGEKVGVVGRTGAGKSSFSLALFRIIEAASGKIFIDGIDISSLGLHDLRTRITIIPQDPVLFSGTLRHNLDPFNQHSDEQVWKCLELAHLKPFVTRLTEGLHYVVEEEGTNFSVGQRQLICLTRALLRKTRILVLDEATAAVDLETDALIQATIRKEFSGSTVITIAHRLNTIMDSDRVMVLDKGRIKEFDSPTNLLAEKGSIFWSMAHDAKLV